MLLVFIVNHTIFIRAWLVGRTNQIVINITDVLGGGRSHVSIITSALFALILLFYAYSIGSYLKVTVYPFENRVVYYKFFDSYIFSQFIDHLVIISAITVWLGFSLKKRTELFVPAIYCGMVTAMTLVTRSQVLLDIVVLISVPFIIFLYAYNRFVHQYSRKILNKDTNSLLLNYLATAGTVIGVIGLFVSAAPLFSVSSYIIYIRNYEYEIYLLLSSFSAILLLLLLNSVPVKILINKFTVSLLGIKLASNTRQAAFYNNRNNDRIKLKNKFIYISLSVLLSIVVGLVPHQSQVNVGNQQIGVDTDYYVRWINALSHAVDYREFIHQAFVVQSFGNEPLTLIFLFSIVKIVNSVNLFFIIEHVPLILGPLLVLVVFFLTRELTSSDIQALMASFLTSVSFQVVIGIYAGFYANWFALIIGYASFLFLLRALKDSNDKLNLAIFSVLLIALMFSHIHTWSVLVIIMGIFMVVMNKLKYYCKRRIVILFLVLSSSVVFDVVRTSMAGSSTALQKDVEFAKATGSGLEQFATRWSNLSRSVYSFVGGQFNNIIIFSLGICWLFQSKKSDVSSIFLMIFLSLGLIAFLFGDYRFQSRIFYDIPFQIPAAIALSSICKFTKGSLVSIPICVWVIGLTIRAASNLSALHSS